MFVSEIFIVKFCCLEIWYSLNSIYSLLLFKVYPPLTMQDRVFIRHQRSENSPFNSHNSLTFTFRSLWFFYSDMEPLSKYSPVMLDLSPATIILNENPAREGEGDWKATLQLSPSFNASCPSHKTVITKEYPSFGEWIHHRGSGLIPTSKMALKQWQRQLKWWKMVQKQDWSCISDKYHH